VEDLSRLEKYIKQFSAFDPTSEAFRYPETRDGKPSLPPTLTSISLRNLADAMQQCAELLDKTSAYLEVDVDLEREFCKDIYPDYPEPF
jgi:hypothetical protein